MSEKTEEITMAEYERRSNKAGSALPVVKAEAVVKVFDKDGKLKSILNFSTEELDNET